MASSTGPPAGGKASAPQSESSRAASVGLSTPQEAKNLVAALIRDCLSGKVNLQRIKLALRGVEDLIRLSLLDQMPSPVVFEQADNARIAEARQAMEELDAMRNNLSAMLDRLTKKPETPTPDSAATEEVPEKKD